MDGHVGEKLSVRSFQVGAQPLAFIALGLQSIDLDSASRNLLFALGQSFGGIVILLSLGIEEALQPLELRTPW
jgi:hypothetical protein